MIALAIVAVSFTILMPQVAHPQQPTVLLSQSAVLTENNYETQYNLVLNKGDKLQIQLSGNGQLVDLTAALQNSPTQLLLDEEAQTYYNIQWSVPQDGNYVFSVIAETGATATILVTKT
jgi:hypothetical protein